MQLHWLHPNLCRLQSIECPADVRNPPRKLKQNIRVYKWLWRVRWNTDHRLVCILYWSQGPALAKATTSNLSHPPWPWHRLCTCTMFSYLGLFTSLDPFKCLQKWLKIEENGRSKIIHKCHLYVGEQPQLLSVMKSHRRVAYSNRGTV